MQQHGHGADPAAQQARVEQMKRVLAVQEKDQ